MPSEALRNSVDLAHHTEEVGYHRWVAEHHGTPMLALQSHRRQLAPAGAPPPLS